MTQNVAIDQARTVAAVLLLSVEQTTVSADRFIADSGPTRHRHRAAPAPGRRRAQSVHPAVPVARHDGPPAGEGPGTHRTPAEAGRTPRPRLDRSTPPRHRATGTGDSALSALLRRGATTGRRRRGAR